MDGMLLLSLCIDDFDIVVVTSRSRKIFLSCVSLYDDDDDDDDDDDRMRFT